MKRLLGCFIFEFVCGSVVCLICDYISNKIKEESKK